MKKIAKNGQKPVRPLSNWAHHIPEFVYQRLKKPKKCQIYMKKYEKQ